MIAAVAAQADLIGPGGGAIDPDADFVDIGFFGTYGAGTPLAIDDGFGQLEMALEVASPVTFAEPGGAGDVMWFFPEIEFGGEGEWPEITDETTVRLTTTLNLQDSDSFNIWTMDIFSDSVDYYDGSSTFEENRAAWLDSGIEVTFNGTPVNNLNAVLSNDDTSLLLAFDGVSGTGDFAVTSFYQSIANLPVINPEGTGTPPGGMSFNYVEVNASSGDTTPGLWSIDAAGLWTSQSSWGPGGPPHSSAPAQFGDVVTQDRTVVINEDVVSAGLIFDSASRYVLGGPGKLTIHSDSESSTIEVLQGQHELQAKVSLNNDTDLTTAGAADLIDFNNTVAFNGNTATISGPGTVNFNNKSVVALSSMVGDYNENGTVDAADYTTWRDAQTAGSSTLPNRDPGLGGAVGEDDFLAWREHFGETGGGGAAASGTLINEGTVGGSGRIAASLLNEIGGTVGPGRSAGTLIVDGDFSQDDLSTLLIELGGTAAGTFDVLDVAGDATLDGELEISLISAFTPSGSNTFDVLTATSISDNGLTLAGDSSGFGFAIIGGGNGQILQLQFSAGAGSGAAAVPEPSSLMLGAIGLGAALVFRRRRVSTIVRSLRYHEKAVGMLVCAWLLISASAGRSAVAQPTLIDFSTNLLPGVEAEGVMPAQEAIAVAGLSGDGTLNVINFPPAGGVDFNMYIPVRAGDEDFYPDHTAGPGAAGDNPLINYFGGDSGLLFEDPTFPTFGVLDELLVSSLWVGRTTFGGTSGEIVGVYENVEQWRVPVSTGTLLPLDEEDPLELQYVEIYTPHGTGDHVNELRFEGFFPAVDDITIGLTGLPATPVGSLDWIAGSYGLANDEGAWTPSSLPDNSTDLSFTNPDSESLIVTDGGLTAKSMLFDGGGHALFLGAGAVTLDANTNDPTIDVLSGDVEFQARVTLVDSLTLDVATGSSMVFNNILDLGGNDLTITSGSDVVFNNLVILGGGSIIGPFGLGAGGVLVSVPEPTTLTLLAIACFVTVVGARRSKQY
jgi:hypothetical protein